MKKKISMLIILLLLMVTSNVYAEPANTSFIDDNLYKCIIDAYNADKEEKKDYTYQILPEELIAITSLDCTKYKGTIENTTGLDKMIGLTSLNISGNTFLGGSLSLKVGSKDSLKSRIIIPTSLSLTNIKYTVDDTKIVSVVDGVVTGIKSGSTFVTMTASVSGNEVKEKHLVSVEVETVKKSSNNSLESLALSYGKIDFSSDTLEYKVSVPNSTIAIAITAKLDDTNASFVNDFGPRSVNLKEGLNTIFIKVKAENGSIKVYTLKITRSDGTNDNNLLYDIELSSGDLDFKSDVKLYTLVVASDIDKIEVTPVPVSDFAEVKVSDTNLKFGENKITITVTAENKKSEIYELVVTREVYESEKNYLKDLSINGYTLDFKKDVYEYNLKIDNDTKLNIAASSERTTSAVSIIGNKNLKNGSKVLIKVTDEEGITRTYTINIIKSFLFDLSIKGIILIVEFLIIFILLLVIIFRPKKRRRKVEKRVNNKICKNCKSINIASASNCYVCGQKL